MTKRLMALAVIALLPGVVSAQPAENLPPPPTSGQAEAVYANCDGSTAMPRLNANDFQCFLDKFAAGKSWEDLYSTWQSQTDAARPLQPAGLQASTSPAGAVSLSWTDSLSLHVYTAGYVVCDGAVVGTFQPGGSSATHSPGPGTHVYSVTVRNVVGQYVYAPVAAAPTVNVSIAGAPSEGWTSFPLEAGALAFYVSSSTGADSNVGTQGAPFRSLSRLYLALRDGKPDQGLLKAGDTWNESFPSTFSKGSGDAGKYMLLGSYGAGPRPKLRVSSPVVYGGVAGKTGLAIVGLDVMPSSPGSGYAAFTFFAQGTAAWTHVLIEDCLIAGFPVNIVCQEIGSGRLNDIKVRRSVIVDSTETASGHSQGIFFGSCDNWVIEGCVLDMNARNKADMFCHNVYIHETCGAGIFNDNITTRACSHGVQQRPGGIALNNFTANNPINFYQGSGGGSNTFRFNVAIDSRDINDIDKRGFGFVLGGRSVIEYNVAAYQVHGSEAVTAFDLDGVNAAVLRGNVVFNWKDPGNHGWATAYQWDGGSGATIFENNAAYMPQNGMCVRHEGFALSSAFTYRNNKYYSTNPATGYEQFSRSGGQGGSFTWWQSQAGDAGSIFASRADPNATIAAYMTSIGTPGDLAEFMAQARLSSKANWRTQYTSDGINDFVRAKFGVQAN